ncbi:MAG: hypothetical protein ACM3X6_05000 [Patescibacteria group bacterium]
MGEQHVPDAIGTETGPPYEPRRGHPNPREIESQKAQVESGHRPGGRKDVKVKMSRKVRGRD